MVKQNKHTRIARLRERMLVRPELCVERAKIWTESYRETEGQPAVLRRAWAFDALLRRMTVRIDPEELIVGSPTSKTRGGSISPELQCDWILQELDLLSTRSTDPFQPLTQEDRKTLEEVVPYWKTRSLRAHWAERTSSAAKECDDLLIGGGAFCGNNQYPGHAAADFQLLLEQGVEGLVGEIDQRIKQGGTQSQLDELRAMKICLEALAVLAERYSEEARRLAATEEHVQRKMELEEIAAVCAAVPRYPARTFREAIQVSWLLYLCIMLENWGTGNTFLRADQYLYSYYEKDRRENRITEENAIELAALLLIKCNSCCVVYSEKRSHGFAGNNSGCSITVGGVKPDGSCAVNPLSCIFLEAERLVHMGSDDIVVRVAENTPEEFLLLACDVARQVGGKLKFLGDPTTVRNLMLDGMTQAQARDYAIAGCTSPIVGGLNYNIPGGIISLPGILELVITNGVHRMSGKRLGVETGDFTKFQDFDAVWTAFCAQVRHVIPLCHEIKNKDKEVFDLYAPSPFQSALSMPCIQSGTDLISGGTKPFYTFAMSLAGAPNVGDSLANLKRYVFEEKRLTLEQIRSALEADFKGYEEIQALLLRGPKFGNADPYVDELVNQVLSFTSDVVAETAGYHGAQSTVAAAAVTANVGLGMCLGATPDGRNAGKPISEGGISPSQGQNITGMTATMLSVAKLDHTKLRHGEVLNLRMSPTAVEGEDKLRKFAKLIDTYLKLGGFLVQFNIVSTETLRAAQLHPERYRDLVVRVATYAAYFVELGPELQNDIIQRLEFEHC